METTFQAIRMQFICVFYLDTQNIKEIYSSLIKSNHHLQRKEGKEYPNVTES